MKKIMLFTSLLLFNAFFLNAQSDYKVVFDLTSKDTVDHKTVIRMLNGISKSTPDAKLEVVLYGQSIDMVLKNKSVVAADIAKLTENKNISFKVCAVTMKRNNVDPSQLVAGAETVPDGIYEIISRQKDGWGYIKVSR